MNLSPDDFESFREGNRLEVKKASEGLPVSLWETYSAIANSYGGVILLGTGEKKDGSIFPTGLKNPDKLIRDFWNQANDRKKVSINLLTDRNIEILKFQNESIIAIEVPKANRIQKPVFINNNLFSGTYRRNGEGDYHCSREEIRAMLRDQIEETMDQKVLDEMEFEDLNPETISAYRNLHKLHNPNHVWEKIPDIDFLERIGALRRSSKDNRLHPTGAGLLMFGDEFKILYEFPEYFLDYREVLDPAIRWTDRIQSSSGDWSGNLFDFFFQVSRKLTRNLKVPFKLDGMIRVDVTPIHKAVREALANCLTNADFMVSRGIVILKNSDSIVIQNPGYIRIGKYQIEYGGVSDPRNKGLMKMFSIVGIGDRAESGVPSIFDVWKNQEWETPVSQQPAT